MSRFSKAVDQSAEIKAEAAVDVAVVVGVFI